MPTISSKVNFDNTANAFAYKSDRELSKANWLFSTMRYGWLVDLGTRITPWAIRIGLPIKGLIRKTIFGQFVGGETLEETAPVAQKLGEFQVKVILDYGVEGGESSESSFEHACGEFIRVINYASTQRNIPFMSIKVTGISRLGLLEKLDRSVEENAGTLMSRFQQGLDSCSAQEQEEWKRLEVRLDRICSAAIAKGVGVLIDAEETWIQDPVDVLSMMMMDRYNRSKAVIFNTLQLYRHDRLSFLRDSIEAAKVRGFILGAKLVRGAYMEKERQRAQERKYPSPIQPDKESTDRDYNEAIRLCIEDIGTVSIIVASHNDHSNLYATRLMDERELDHRHPNMHFSQLFGMSDHITFNLASSGFSVSKYLPFGPISDVVPYLMRRAQENSSMTGQTGRELTLIRKEMKRRENLS
jgi:proline dehydrogenase